MLSIGGLASIEETGVPVVDNFVGGVPFCVLDNYTFYKLPKAIDRVSVPSVTWDELASMLVNKPPSATARWAIVHYAPIGPAAVSHEAIYDTLAERLLRFDVAFCVAELDALHRVVLIRKKCFKAFPDFGVACMSHKVLGFACGSNATNKKVVEKFSHCCVRSRSNLLVQSADPGTLSFEQVLDATSRLDPADLRALRGTIVVKPVGDRTEHDRAILRCLPLIGEIRADREPLGDSSLFWKVSRPPMKIAPQRFFRTDYDVVDEHGVPVLDAYGKQVVAKMVGRRFLGQSPAGKQEHMECDLEHFLDHPELLQEHAVVFMGANSTTGYGKSTIARFLACKFAVHMTTVLNRPKTEATVLNSTTLDDLSGVSCKSGWAVMLDELAIGCKEAVQYMSTDMMKTLCDPQSTGGLRARGKNVVLASNTARIFTTNATSLDEWARGRFTMDLPIHRKLWVFIIEHPMIEGDWAKRNDYVGSELF